MPIDGGPVELPIEPDATAGAPLGVRIFTGPSGIRAGWRFLLFFLVCAGLAWALYFVLGGAFDRLPGDAAMLNEWLLALAALGGTVAMSVLEKRPFVSFGLGPVNRWRNFGMGIAIGFLSLSLLIGLLTAAGAFHPGPVSLHGSEAVVWDLFWAVVFVGVAFAEEVLMRGYPLFALSQGIGFWPAAVILSVLFGAGHQANPGEQMIGIVNAVLVGLVLAYSVRWSGSLWWAIGYHISWDWAETFFYGVGDSGHLAEHHLLSGVPAGPGWLSGGSVGPEGSVLCLMVIVLLAGAVRVTTQRCPVSGLERLKSIRELT